MDHLIVAQRQHEVFVEGIQHAERQLVVVILPVDGVIAEVVQCVVHPPHVPLHAEAESAEMRRPRNHGV